MTSSPQQQQQQQQPPPPPIEDLDWEEWDSTTGLSFTHHCLAGSFAGVAEHTLLYPLDTVKTCWQSQVLHRAAAGGSGGGTHIAAAGCDPCSVHQTVNKLATTTSTATSSSIVSSASNNTTASAASQHHQQSIWSTMKHLMRHGSHHHNHHHSAQFSHPHAHVTTLANGNTTSSSHLAPNVVDLTNNSTATINTSSSGGRNKQQRRPWSKSARMVRGATLHDIAPSLQPSLYHTTGTTTTTSASGGGALSSSLSSTINSTNIQNVASSGINNSTNNTGFKRLWRGVQTMFVGCIPAHALYFSSYEGIKSMCLTHNTTNNNNSNNTTKNNSHAHVNETSQQQQHHHVGIDTLSPLQAMFAGGIATLLHDFIMTPMDTMKQRMQLGHYYNLRDAFCSIVWGDRQLVSGNGSGGNSSNTIKEGVRMGGEGWKGLYRSFPITVMTNVPYGMIMMTTNEWLRAVLEDGLYGFHEHNHHHHPGGGDEKPFHFATILLSGMGAGMVASAITAPLDRVKTRLQTQRMGMMIPSVVPEGGGVGSGGGGGGGGSGAIMEERALAAAMGERKVCPKMAVQDVKSALFPSTSSSTSSVVASSSSSSSIGGGGSTSGSFIPRSPSSVAQSPFTKTYYTTPIEAFQSIIQEEGPRGLFRGALPRVALHAPSVAISWTAYEMAKGWLLWAQ